ncbi:MAG: ABC transporter permease [Muribaculaceae bacterium]|nr:ABC transporter permease [Muribaculaceae bacterium]
MNSKIGIIIAREFLQRVTKKSFIITTILFPVLMIGLMIAPALIMAFSTTETKEIYVIDHSGIVAQNLKSSDEVSFVIADEGAPDTLRTHGNSYGVLFIGNNIVEKPGNVQLYTGEASSMAVERTITSQMEEIIKDEKLKQYNIENINEILRNVETTVTLQTFRTDSDNEESTSSSSMVSYAIGTLLSLVLYMFLLMYGQMVMTSIIEEKNNRVLEVMVSSVKPTQLMVGKILGIGSVAVTQIAIWGVLISSAVGILLPMLLPADIMAQATALNAGTLDSSASNVDADLLGVIAAAGNVAYIVKLFALMAAFLLGGFLFYASMFAAIGSAVDNIQDASQLQTAAIMPIIIALVISMSVATDPNSPLAFWTSLVPFTSPMIMMMRIPFGIATWEIALSLGILYISIIGMIWIAAKIYRVGIFMYGKKPSLKELIRWINYK